MMLTAARCTRVPVRIGMALACLLLGAGAQAGTAPAANEACLRCHGAGTLTRRGPNGEGQSVTVDREAFAHSEHGRLACTVCHGRSFTTYPHPPARRLQCMDCHAGNNPVPGGAAFAEIREEFRQSVHFQQHGDSFPCARCHNSHDFRRWKDVSRQSISQQNGVCLTCHASPGRSTPAPGRPLRDVAQAHAWLPHRELHQQRVRCLDCHSSYEPPVRSHRILPASQAVRDCVACHSANSLLKVKLYRHARAEETTRLGFLNAVIINDAYVIGATRNRLVDLAGGLAVLGALLGATGHGLLRARARRFRGRGDS